MLSLHYMGKNHNWVLHNQFLFLHCPGYHYYSNQWGKLLHSLFLLLLYLLPHLYRNFLHNLIVLFGLDYSGWNLLTEDSNCLYYLLNKATLLIIHYLNNFQSHDKPLNYEPFHERLKFLIAMRFHIGLYLNNLQLY